VVDEKKMLGEIWLLSVAEAVFLQTVVKQM
jgi:hypothetical protein